MATNQAMTSSTSPAISAHHQWVTKLVTASSARVAGGSVAWRLEKNDLNRGSTKLASTTMVITDISAMIDGYTRAALTLRRASRSRSRYLASWSSTMSSWPVSSAE